MRVRTLAMFTIAALAVGACGNADDDDDSASDGTQATAPVTTGAGDFDEFVQSDEPGVTDDEIRVVVITSKTNPMGGKYEQLADGIQAYFDMINSEGGIYGRELVIAKERDDVVGLQNQQEVQASLAEDNAFATFLATLGGGGFELLDDAGMPSFIWNIRPEMAGHPNIFGSEGALCWGCIDKTIPWIAQQVGAEQAAVLGYGVAAEAKNCAAGYRDSFEHFGTAELVFFDDTLQFAQPDLSAQVAQMKEKGVDYVMTCMDINETLVLAKEMAKQGLEAVQNLPNGYDHDFVKANAEYYEGSYVIPQYLGLEHEPQIEELQTMVEWVEKGGYDFVETTGTGWLLAHMFVDGLKLAGPEFTQQGLIDALNTQTDVRINGMIDPIDWTTRHEDPKDHPDKASEYDCDNILRIEDGEFVAPFGEPGKPWLCFDPSISDEIDEPVPASFVPED